MKFLKKPFTLILLTVLFAGSASASSSFSGSADLTFALSGDLDGVNVTPLGDLWDEGSLMLGDATSSQTFNFPSTAQGSFASSGQVNDSEDEYQDVVSAHTAQFTFWFDNQSTGAREFSLSLNYILHAVASGEYASSVVQITSGDYDSDEASAYLFDDQENVTVNGSFEPYVFNLAAGTDAYFDVYVGVTGNIKGTTPVPLPAAVWSFLMGLMGVFGFARRARVGRVV